MTLVTPQQSNPGEEANASDINTPINQLAAVINGNIDDDNVSSLSGTKISAGTLPGTAHATGSIPTAAYATRSVTQEKLGATIVSRAYLSTAQNVANGVAAKVLLDGESFDLGSDYDTANKRFVAPVKGYYQVNASVSITDIADTASLLAYIYVNGVEVANARTYSAQTNGDPQTALSDIVFADAGQFIELYCLHNSGVTEALTTGSTATFMSISLVGAVA